MSLSHYGIYEVSLPAPKPELGAPAPKVSGPREQYGAGALIAVDALVRALAALLLLGLRRKGPGLWWTALCVAMALGVTLGPATVESFSPTTTGDVIRNVSPSVGVQIGGIASPPSVVGPETWGLLLLAVEMLLLHQAINLGKTWRLYALVPVFLLWANMDESFAVGLVILAASAIGMLFDSRRGSSRPSGRPAWIAFGVAGFAIDVRRSVARLRGPGGIRPRSWKAIGTIPRSIGLNIGVAFGSVVVHLLGDSSGRRACEGVFVKTLRFYYFALAGLGLASFLLNRRDFALGRFLPFAVACQVLWALGFNIFYAVLFAVVLGRLDGDERPGVVSADVRARREARGGLDGLVDRRSPGGLIAADLRHDRARRG